MIEQRSKEWFAQRLGRVTASAVGAILGHAPYMTRADVMRRMVRSYHEAESEFSGNVATEWGTFNEPGAIFEFTLETGFPVYIAPFVRYENWAGASPDGYVENDWLLEVKCPYKFRKDPAPEFQPAKEQQHYYDQMQFQMLCTGKRKCYFWQWAPYGKFLEVVEYDQSWMDSNIPILRAFHAEYLSELENPIHLQPLRETVETQKAVDLVNEYDKLTDDELAAKTRKAEVLAQLVELANCEDSVVAGRKLTRMKRTGSISYAAAVAELAPDADLSKWKGEDSEYWRLF